MAPRARSSHAYRDRYVPLGGIVIAVLLLFLSSVEAGNDDDSPATIGNSVGGKLPADARPTLTADDYKKLAVDLRAAYAKPPDQWPKADLEPGVELHELGQLPPPPQPQDNPSTRQKVALGKKLFFDPRLSGSGQFSCASCHNPELGWSDGSQLAFGHDRARTKRNTPPIMDTAYNTSQFWDGRAATLEAQALGPITTDTEMHGDVEAVKKAVNGDAAYKKAFAECFDVETVTVKQVTAALACFERSVNGGNSAFDRFLRGHTTAMTDAAVRGLHVFRTQGGCLNCHNGPNFSDDQFHNDGLSNYGTARQDVGRYEVTKKPEDVGAFRTPTLRNIERTGPYMHSGFFEIDEVLRLYNSGMFTIKRTKKLENDPLFPTKDKLLRVRNMNRQDLDDLKAFLFSLTEPKQYPPR